MLLISTHECELFAEIDIYNGIIFLYYDMRTNASMYSASIQILYMVAPGVMASWMHSECLFYLRIYIFVRPRKVISLGLLNESETPLFSSSPFRIMP